MLQTVIQAREAAISESMKVKRILPFRLRRMVGPFIFMDHAGPVEQYASQSFITRRATASAYRSFHRLLSFWRSGNASRQSGGSNEVIRPGEVNWMTAGSGIAHSERFEDPAVMAGGELEMIQTWVALPEKEEEAAPTFKITNPRNFRFIQTKASGCGCLLETHMGFKMM